MKQISIGDKVLTCGGRLGRVLSVDKDELEIEYYAKEVSSRQRNLGSNIVTLKRKNVRKYEYEWQEGVEFKKPGVRIVDSETQKHIRALYADKNAKRSTRSLAAQFGVSQYTIRNIVRVHA